MTIRERFSDWVYYTFRYKCGCSLLDRIEIRLLRKKVMFPRKGFKEKSVKGYGKVRGKAEKELIKGVLQWGEHMRDRMPISCTGDTLVMASDYFKHIEVYTIRKVLTWED